MIPVAVASGFIAGSAPVLETETEAEFVTPKTRIVPFFDCEPT